MSNTSVEDAKSGFLEEGFYQFEDPEIGSKIEEMRAHHLPFSMSEETGLDFWRKNIRYNTKIQDILSALGPEPQSRVIADGRIGYRREYERSYVWAYAKLNVLEQYLEEQRKSQTPGRPVGVQPPASCDVDELVKLGVHVLR
ncbi:hypothetical protein H9Q73_007130 [Fusarium xylarioides]|nr:hypothetical protein H9Q73_007130 [Fusarium xylarioides]